MTQRVIEMPDLGMGTFRLEGKTAYESVKMALELDFATLIPRKYMAMKSKLAKQLKTAIFLVKNYL